MRFYLFVLPLVFCSALLAQKPDQNSPASIAKFKIVKRTIEFLSTDTASFKGITVNVCHSCADYGQVRQFAAKITKADVLIDQWIKTTVGGNKADLTQFRKAVLHDITSGSARKENRLNAPGFKGYDEDITGIIESAFTPATAAASEQPVPAIANNSEVGDAETPTAENPDEDKAPIPVAIDINNNKRPLIADMPWIFVATTLLGALLALYFYADGRKHKMTKESLKRQLKDQHELMADREKDFQRIKTDVKTLKEELEEAELRYEEMSEKQAAERKQYQQRVKDARQIQLEPELPVSFSKGFTPVVKYARYADKVDGFSSADLLDQDDNETIFEITITSPGTGAFRISNNRQAQRYALSNASYFFSNTCQYDSLPLADSVIVTNTPGQLELNGDKWTIRYPAKISFN
jgi:hypothetical protein